MAVKQRRGSAPCRDSLSFSSMTRAGCTSFPRRTAFTYSRTRFRLSLLCAAQASALTDLHSSQGATTAARMHGGGGAPGAQTTIFQRRRGASCRQSGSPPALGPPSPQMELRMAASYRQSLRTRLRAANSHPLSPCTRRTCPPHHHEPLRQHLFCAEPDRSQSSHRFRQRAIASDRLIASARSVALSTSLPPRQ